MIRIAYFPTYDEMVFLCENFNTNVRFYQNSILLYPTNEDSAVQCLMLGVSEVQHQNINMKDVYKWIQSNCNQSWIQVMDDGFISYHQ